MTRRSFVSHTAAVSTISLFGSAWIGARTQAASRKEAPIRALPPRDTSGHQFVLYSDCTVSGPADKRSNDALDSINRVIQRLEPQPQFIAFPGDAVGTGANANEWEFFLDRIKWTRERNIPVYQSTSNHNAHNFLSEANFRRYHPDLPLNGRGDQKGLAYWIRRGNLLYISVHHPIPNDNYRPGFDFGDLEWVDEVLMQNADAAYKLVAGHYPVWRVNAYTGMSIPRESWEPFWSVLRKHHVDAYLTSHVLAFDVQVHDGILQICSGGAGPDLMPPQTEGTHAVQIAMDRQGMRYQVLNTAGKVREYLVWPLLAPEDASWDKTSPRNWLPIENGQPAPLGDSPQSRIALYRISGLSYFANPHVPRINLIEGHRGSERTMQVWFDLLSLRLYVTLELEGVGAQHWMGPVVTPKGKSRSAIDIQIALHPGMGPGGVLWRWDDSSPWNSMETTSAFGLEAFRWPESVSKTALTTGSGENKREVSFQVLHARMPVPQII